MKSALVTTFALCGVLCAPHNALAQEPEVVTRSVNMFVGPETLPPRGDIFVSVEVERVDGRSVPDGIEVTLTHYGFGGQRTLYNTTRRGVAQFLIEAGRRSGTRVFIANVANARSEEISVEVTSGKVSDVPTRIFYDPLAHEAIATAGPIKDVFGNPVEDGTVAHLSTRTSTAQHGLFTAVVHDGFAQWTLPCVRFPAGLQALTVTLKDAQISPSFANGLCRSDGVSNRAGA